MKQELDLDAVIRRRIRGLRVARGWSLDALAARCYLSPSTLSRIETGHRRIALDQLVPIARALDTTLDHLVEAVTDDDVVIRPEPHQAAGVTTWLMSRESTVRGVTVAKMRFSPDHPSGPDHPRSRVVAKVPGERGAPGLARAASGTVDLRGACRRGRQPGESRGAGR